MNKKNKLLLTTIGLVVLSGAAATGSTFAWFTTVRSAIISFTSATVETKNNDLSVKYISSLNSVTATTNLSVNEGKSSNNVVLSGLNKVTDISGDGINFYKPVWSAYDPGDASIADYINEIDLSYKDNKGNLTKSADGYLIDFTLEIARGVNLYSPNDLNIYFDRGTLISPIDVIGENQNPSNAQIEQQDRNNKVVEAVRMAVIETDVTYDITDPDNPVIDDISPLKPIFYYAPHAEPLYNYLSEDSGGTTYTILGYSNTSILGDAADPEDVINAVEGIQDDPSTPTINEKDSEFKYFSTVVEAEDANYKPLLTLTEADPTAHITFRFWVEGEDDDAVNAAIGGVFSIDLRMYALSVI